MKILLTGLIIFVSLSCFSQAQKDYLLSYIDTTSGESLVGFKNKAGKIIIKAKYWNFGYEVDNPEKMYQFACMYGDSGWVYINRKDRVILKPFIYDNGPDYHEEGLFRFVENGKIGFANKKLQKIISAKYSFATPFKEGLAEFYIGGERIYIGGLTAAQIYKAGGSLTDRHWTWGGYAESGAINKYGQEFDSVTVLKNNVRKAFTKTGQSFLLNKDGRVIKKLLSPAEERLRMQKLFTGKWEKYQKYYSTYFDIKFEEGKDYATVKDIGTGEAPPRVLKAQVVDEKLIIHAEGQYGRYCEMEIKNGQLFFLVLASKHDNGNADKPPTQIMIKNIFNRVPNK